MAKRNKKEEVTRRNIRNRQARIQEEARKRLQEILNEPERKAAEARFAAEHSGDSDEELLSYIKREMTKAGNCFKRSRLIGYLYIVERFGCWENAVGVVNRRIKEEKAALLEEERAPKMECED